ncbi:glycoside hydrolase family 27 protein [Streptomyces sp. SID8382]|uniref:glycoside hydrolase family 27 protein n=1 Tax=Streptomyces malaysiensis TaxID=92644 RepID=UPI000C2C036E|nr:glycoside hydrolase family 27 protein [Streptomyces sp. M56]AUA10648.1 Alpha-galactosidase A precursor [Streptomyces sp. M56]MYX59252.1 glycoside hydrolase family 27 protein [Streptomyces sp. SID8382]
MTSPPPVRRPRHRTPARGAVATAIAVVLATAAAPTATAAPAVDQGAPDYYDSGLAPTPYMGWNTYYGLGAPTEKEVRSVADRLVSSGLRDSGYDIVWLDGGWQADNPRNDRGQLAAHPDRFPSGIPALVSYLHQRGLRAGIYTDAGTYDGGKSCGLGSRGHYTEDARQFAGWKIDAIKVDFLCGIGEKLDPGPAFKEFGDAVAKSGRRMLLNLCNPLTDDWGLPHTPEQDAHNSYGYAPTIADSWRTGTDIAWGTPSPGQWPNVLRNMDANAWHPEAQGPGHYNDPDYLIPMRRMADGSLELTEEESTTQLVMWAEMGSPLVIGSDPRTLSDSMLRTLRNPEIIAVDQDPLGVQGVRVATDSAGDVYSKVLSGHGRRAVVLLNRSDRPAERTVNFSDVALGGPVKVRDLRARADRGRHTGSYTAEVPAHGTAFLTLTGEDALPGAALGEKTSASPAVVRDGETLTTFFRGPGGTLGRHTEDGGGRPRTENLGGPANGRILGQPAAHASADGRIDVFVRGADSRAYRRVFAHGRWGAWQDLGGKLTDAPSVAFTDGEHWTLTARGADGRIVQRGPSSGWSSLGAPGDRPTYGRPSAVVDAQGRTHVAVRTSADEVWTRSRDASGQWSRWSSLGGTVSGSPTLVAAGDAVVLYARAGDYTLWQRRYENDGWQGWTKRPEFPSAAFDGALGAVAGPDGVVDAVYRGVDGSVHRTQFK